MRTFKYAIILLALAAAPAAMATDRVEMRLVGDGAWTLEENEAKCLLNRRVIDTAIANAGDEPIGIISLELAPVTKRSWLKLALRDDDERRRDDDDNAVVFLDETEIDEEFHYNIFSLNDFRVREYMLNVADVDFGSMNDTIRLSTPRHGDFTITLPEWSMAWDALRACGDKLNAELGVTPEDVARVAEQPEGNWIRAGGWNPSRSPRKFQVFFWVNEDGRVEDCRLLGETGNPSFDESFCAKLERKGRFTTAKDSDGNSVRAPQFHDVSMVSVAVRN